MDIGIIGLGRMGANIARRLMRAGHRAVVFDRDPAAVKMVAEHGGIAATSAPDVIAKLTPPCTVWLMLPSGAVTEDSVAAMSTALSEGDILIDGGNSFFKDSVRRGQMLAGRGIRFLDVGTSGGVWGLERGYCMMIGGDKEAVDRLDPIFDCLAPGLGDIPKTPGRD
uniref:NAD(P)-binding domain-containing protein n=1 Tax=Aestuariivirga sp. TaxID=2650926 RepID=UPI003593EFE7